MITYLTRLTTRDVNRQLNQVTMTFEQKLDVPKLKQNFQSKNESI